MRIGILTFHSQLNYGGVLQCWALKKALEDMGHEVVVVDRWLSPDNRMLDGPFGHAGLKGWCVIALKSMLGCGTWKQVLRHWRTRWFVRSLNLTPYHFYNWLDLASQPQPFNLNLDILVVGSDQVWHGGDWGDPGPYLLEGAPQIPAIAYAASFGMRSLPEGIDYRNGLKRFSAISVREAEGIGLVESLGMKAMHVVDPTLLLDSSRWAQMGVRRKVPRRIVCYFLSQKIAEAVKVLEPWARQNGCTVEIVCDGMLKAAPRTVRECVLRLIDMAHCVVTPARVRICTGYGPREFVRAFAQAEMCITDSFHAVMFSSIFNCNARFLRPTTEMRRGMFARIEEFAKECITGGFFVDDVSEALSAFERGETVSFKTDRIAAMRAESMKWIEGALKEWVRG